VKARSYALAHVASAASRVFYLGDTTRWQAYRGRGSVRPLVLEATETTEGMILSYGGGMWRASMPPPTASVGKLMAVWGQA